jgi:hypothetical protein
VGKGLTQKVMLVKQLENLLTLKATEELQRVLTHMLKELLVRRQKLVLTLKVGALRRLATLLTPKVKVQKPQIQMLTLKVNQLLLQDRQLMQKD